MAYVLGNAEKKMVATSMDELPSLGLVMYETLVRMVFISGDSGKMIKMIGIPSSLEPDRVAVSDAVGSWQACGPNDQLLYLEVIPEGELFAIGQAILKLYEKIREQK